MEIKIITPEQLDEEEKVLLNEASRLLKKIARLNGLYNSKLMAVYKKLELLKL